jgi:hypothetical protein
MKNLLIVLAIVAIASTKSFAYTGFVETTQYAPYQERSYTVDPDGVFVSWDLYAYGASGTFASIYASGVLVNYPYTEMYTSDIVYSNGTPASKYGSHWFYPDAELEYVDLVVYKTDIWDFGHHNIIRIGYASASASWY